MPVTAESHRAQQDITRLVCEVTSNAVTALDIRVDDSSILIEGQAASYYVKQLVTQAALAECRGRCVRNGIRVRSPR